MKYVATLYVKHARSTACTERRFMEGLEVSAEALEKAEAELEEAENSGDTFFLPSIKKANKSLRFSVEVLNQKLISPSLRMSA